MSLPLPQPLAAGLLALSLPLTLAGCAAPASPQSSAGEGYPDLSAAVVLSAYELPDGSCALRYPSGEAAAVLDADDAFRGFPGRSSSEGEGDGSGVPAYFGQAPDGTLYAVTCSGPSAGSSRCNILLTTDAGESWTVTGEEPFPLSMVTGAGFQSAQVGFLCSRYFQDSGPEIYLTRDGGESWVRLDLDRPEQYSDCSMTPGTPIITSKSVSFPIQAVRAEGELSLTCSSRDLEHWTWTEN